jgi:hypothetical protein
MKALQIIAYIAAAIFIVLGFLFILAAFGETFNSGWACVGGVGVLIGFGLIAVAAVVLRKKIKEQAAAQNVVLNIDLPGNVKMDTIKCKSCGGTLAPENISMVAGAPVVTCPFCNTTYQLTEEPKW